jgi:hypothetical protein
MTAQMMFVLALAVFVGVPYLIRTWRDLKFAKHRIDLSRSEVELLSALFNLAERVGAAEDVSALRDIAKYRLRVNVETLSVTKQQGDDTARDRSDAAAVRNRTQVTVWLFLGGLASFIITALGSALGLMIMLAIAAACIGTGRLRTGSVQRRAFYAGVTYVPIAELLLLIIWGVASSS